MLEQYLNAEDMVKDCSYEDLLKWYEACETPGSIYPYLKDLRTMVDSFQNRSMGFIANNLHRNIENELKTRGEDKAIREASARRRLRRRTRLNGE